MHDLTVDIAIVGGGVIGLAIARQLAGHSSSLRIAVVEKEKNVAQGSAAVTVKLYTPLPCEPPLFGIESPGLTNCLSLADWVSAHMENVLR